MPAGEHLYWADEGTFSNTGASNKDGTINESNLDGTGQQVLLTKQAGPTGLAVDGSPYGIYWTEFSAGTVAQASPSASATACTAGNFYCTKSLVTGQTDPVGLAVNGSASGGFIYWAVEGGAGINDGTIMRADLGGGNITTLVSGLNAPYGVTIDSGHIYWTDLGTFNPLSGATNSDGKIMEANLDGTGVTTLASSQASPTGIAVNASHIYWADACSGTTLGGTIMESNLDGTAVTTLVSGLDCPTGVAVDSSHLYWSDGADGTITAAGLDGSSPNVVISGQFNVDAVAAG